MRSLIFIILLMSCSPAWHLKQAERHLKKAEIKGATVRVDTVYKNVPVYIDSVVVDSIFVSNPGDTIIITKDRLKIKYVHLKGDSIYIEGKCDADTVEIRVPVTVTKEIKAKGLDWKWLVVAFVLGFITLLIVRRL